MAAIRRLHRGMNRPGECLLWGASDVEYTAITLLMLHHRMTGESP